VEREETRDAGAWWLKVAVGRGNGEKAPKIKRRRLLAAPDAGDSLLYPALGLDAKGKRGLVVFTVTGVNHYPSPGFSVISRGKPRKDVHLVAEGVAQACIYDPDFGASRWGDYHTVRMDEEGNFYGTVEWIASQVGGGGVGLCRGRTGKCGMGFKFGGWHLQRTRGVCLPHRCGLAQQLATLPRHARPLATPDIRDPVLRLVGGR
jgi:hypothetical protein